MKKTYRVTGVQPVHGHEPGQTFQHDFPELQEQQLLAGGAISVAKEPAKSSTAAKAAAAPKPTRKRQEA